MHTKSNFFAQHYDWLVALAGLAALAGAAVMLMPAISVTPDEAAERRKEQLNAVTPANEKVDPVAIEILQSSLRQAKKPQPLADVDPAAASFLASERRVFCKPGDPAVKSCGAPIPAGCAECPHCKASQESVKKESADNDGDGLPNNWEKRYGLNPNDPSDADKDIDSDGFTNAEEFAAKTNPADAASHPPYADPRYLSVQGGLKQVFLPFWFNSVSPIPGGHRFMFRSLKRLAGDSNTFNPKDGEEIGKTGWTVGEYTKLSKEVVIEGSGTKAKKSIDASTVEVVRKSDGRKLVLRIGDRRVALDSEATLVWDRFGGKTFNVKEGDVIDLNGEKHRVSSLKPDGKADCIVVLEKDGAGASSRITLKSRRE